MGGKREWDTFADQDVREIRLRYQRDRVRVLPDHTWSDTPHLLQVSRTSGLPADWFRSLGLKRQFIVRGAAASQDSRKAVLVGEWAAAQWGMWFVSPDDHSVLFALPQGHVPPRKKWPVSTQFKSFRVSAEETVELDGVRITHPLRTYVDLCRLQHHQNARLAVGWLRNQGITNEEISKYAARFPGPIHSNRRSFAEALPFRVPELGTYPYMLAFSLLDGSRLPLRANCDLDGMGFATLLAGNDLVIAIDEDPYWRTLESEPEGPRRAHNQRKRERWEAARGFRKLYFTAAEIERAPKAFVSEVLGAAYLRDRQLVF